MHVWRERLDRWFRPIATKCPLSPNAITIIAFLFVAGAATALGQAGSNPPLFLIAALLVAIGGLLDAFDGIVARAQNKSSRFGDFLDHFFDRAADSLLVAGWIIGTGVRPPLGLATLIVISLNGYIGTQIEATFGERSYEGTGRGEFVLGLIVFPLAGFSLTSSGILFRRFAGLSVPEWLTLLMLVVALQGVVQRLRRARRLAAASQPGADA